MRIELGGVLAGSVLAQKGFEGCPDVFFLLNLYGLEIGRLDLREKLNHAAAVIARAQRFDLAVTEKIGGLGQLLRCFERRRVVRVEIVAVGAMESVDVPE